MVIWLSGLQTIPGELYEAADIDGAEQVAAVPLRHLARPAGDADLHPHHHHDRGVRLFTQVNIMTQGGPLDSTSTLVLMAVRTGYQQQQTGYASAISLVFFVLVLAVTLVNRYFTRDKDVDR